MTGRKPRAAFLQVGIFIPDPWAGHSLDKTKPHPNTDFHRSWNWWSHFFFFIFLIQHKFTCDKHLAVYLTFLMTKGSAAHSVCLTYPTKLLLKTESINGAVQPHQVSSVFTTTHLSRSESVGKGNSKESAVWRCFISLSAPLRVWGGAITEEGETKMAAINIIMLYMSFQWCSGGYQT